jgi:DNA-binding Xre family transcriptional regulator
MNPFDTPQNATECCDCENFGILLLTLLENKNVNQSDLCEKINITAPTLNRYIHEGPRHLFLADIDEISKHLPCHPSEKAKLVKAFLCYQFMRIGLWEPDPDCRFLDEVPKRSGKGKS